MIIHVVPERAALDAVQNKLTELGKEATAGSVIKKAINEVGTSVQERLYNETKDTYTIKRAEFKKSDITKTNMTAKRPETVIRVKGIKLGLKKGYKTKRNGKRKGAAAMVLKSGSMKDLTIQSGGRNYKAFVAKVTAVSKGGSQSSHEGIFRRVPGKTMDQWKGVKRMKSSEKIKEMTTMAKSKAAETVYRDKIQGDLQGEINESLMKHMEAVIGV